MVDLSIAMLPTRRGRGSRRIDLSMRQSVLDAVSDKPAKGKKKAGTLSATVEERLAAAARPPPVEGAVPIKAFEDVEAGMVVAGFVRNPSDKGVFVTLAPGVTGRVKVRRR